VRLVLFTIVWLFTFGKHHFWLLPNLTEDVGFMESFWPLYKHDLKNNDSKEDKKKKRKDSDISVTHIDEDKSLVDPKESGSESASTVESIAKTNSSVESGGNNKDGTNGFEILDSNEIEEEEELKDHDLKDIRE
jgi:translocation protein SEC62